MPTQQERDRIERRLLDERERALETLAEFDAQFADSLRDRVGDLGAYRLHMADLGTESMEQEKQFSLASKGGDRLYALDAALRRLYDDPETFGRCERCGRQISLERLELVPEGVHCADCQRAVESGA